MKWTRVTRKDVSSAGQVHHLITADTKYLALHCDSDVYIYFDGTSDTANTTDDLILNANQLTIIDTPRDSQSIAGARYFHSKQVVSATGSYLRIVEL